ncbi:hypothetical protein ACOMHN_004715 [Nucella lapillus]
MEPANWKDLIGRHLGRKYLKRTRDLMWDLVSVDCGLKPALLLDFAVPSSACVVTLLHSLKSTGLINNPLTVVTIHMDVLIVNPASFNDTTKNPLSGVLFVDVSGNLDDPRLLSESCHLLQETRQSFCGVLEKLGSASGGVDLSVHCDPCTNPSTLFGLFLGYPVVYYYDMAVDSLSNCLSMVPLVNLVLKGTVTETPHNRLWSAERPDHRPCSTERPDINRPCSTEQVNRLCSTERIITSFSVPQSFMGLATGGIDSWFEEKRERAVQCKAFGQLDLGSRVVQLPSVCL